MPARVVAQFPLRSVLGVGPRPRPLYRVVEIDENDGDGASHYLETLIPDAMGEERWAYVGTGPSDERSRTIARFVAAAVEHKREALRVAGETLREVRNYLDTDHVRQIDEALALAGDR